MPETAGGLHYVIESMESIYSVLRSRLIFSEERHESKRSRLSIIICSVFCSCNPFDPAGSTKKSAEKTTLSGNPAPGKIKKDTKVELVLSEGGMATADLWLNGTPLTARISKPENEKSALEKQCVRGTQTSDAVLVWTCKFEQKTTIDYQITVGSVESKSTGPTRNLGTYEVE